MPQPKIFQRDKRDQFKKVITEVSLVDVHALPSFLKPVLMSPFLSLYTSF